MKYIFSFIKFNYVFMCHNNEVEKDQGQSLDLIDAWVNRLCNLPPRPGNINTYGSENTPGF